MKEIEEEVNSLERYLLEAKNYKIFLSLTIPLLLVSFIPNFDSNVYLIKVLFVILAFVAWIFVLGRALNLCIPVRYRLNEMFQIVNLFVFTVLFVPIMIFLDYKIIFYGFARIIPLLIIFNVMYLFYFTSKALVTAEVGRRVLLKDHILELLLLMIGYLGVWIIQPRINKLWDKKISCLGSSKEEP
jgi:hypothetical protein